jgi:phosphoribosylformylglycinamidine synthase
MYHISGRLKNLWTLLSAEWGNAACDTAAESGTVRLKKISGKGLTKTVAQNYRAKIYVTLRPSVLDPAGVAVQSGLSHMGYDNIAQVRIGKYIELMISAVDQTTAETQLDRMCDQLLANPVIENYRFELTELSQVATGAEQ